MWALFILIVIIIIILIVSFVPNNNISSTLPINFNTFIRSNGGNNFYTVYFKLKDISIDELETSSNTSPLSVETIRSFVDLEEKEKAIQWLKTNGTFYQWEGTGTMGGWQPSQDFLSGIELYSATGFVDCTLNNYYQFPFGITVNLFNQVSDPNTKLLPLSKWVEDKGMFGYSSNPSGATAFNIPTSSTSENSIFLYETQSLSIQSIEVFTEYYNNKYSTAYPVQHFLDRLHTFIISPSLEIIPSPLTEGTYINDLENNTEALVDVFTVFEINPNFNIYASPGIMFSNNFIVDTNPIIQSFISNKINCYIFSSSITSNYKTNIRDYSRVSIESRLYSLLGFTQFNASGDQGPWYNGNIDIYRPDAKLGGFIGDGIISVGGYTSIEEELISMNQYSITGINVTSLPFASGGGLMRYYSNPVWKKNYSFSYRKKDSVKEVMLSTGEISTLSVQINNDGIIYPDIVGHCSISLPLATSPLFGTSIATPTVAAQFANLGKRVKSFHRMLYSPDFSFTEKRIQGRNTFGPLLGYCGDSQSQWDPVNGRGIINFEKLKEYLK